MPVREGPAQRPPPPKEPKDYPAEKARAGETILRTPTRRAIFVFGLAAAVVLALLIPFLA
jgi:hypothetical protein